jgi:uncharacterized repeat protein (TIGR03803 family)
MATLVPNSSPTLTQNAIEIVTLKAFSQPNCAASSALGLSVKSVVTITSATLLLTPRNTSIKQTQQQTLLVQASGTSTTNLSYQWTTTGGAGLLNEVGGQGHTDQTSYCSTSTQTTYVPASVPSLTVPVTDVVTVQAFTSPVCDPAQAVSAPVFTTVMVIVPHVTGEKLIADIPGNLTGADLIQASDGNFYGALCQGGTSGMGSIFKMTPAGVVTTLYSLSGSDGNCPYSGVIQGWDGNFYGTTASGGGSNGAGTIFTITPKGSFTSLYTFTGGADGANPAGALVQGTDGTFYGTTQEGGDTALLNPSGTVYNITSSGAFSIVATFNGTGAEAVSPIAWKSGTLVQGSDGNFYGTGQQSGPSGTGYAQQFGTIFSVTPTGNPTLLWTFTGNNDGGKPTISPLVQGPTGGFFGTTTTGGQYNAVNNGTSCGNGTCGNGTVFEYTPGNVAQVFNFSTASRHPQGGVILATDGNLYGTGAYDNDLGCNISGAGSTNGCGGVIEVTAGTGGTENDIYQFKGTPDASFPGYGSLLQASDGNLYGTTAIGGPSNGGAVYEIGFTPALPAPIQLTFSNTAVAIDQPVQLQWQVLDAFSATTQLCVASIQGTPVGAGVWSGLQTGALSGSVYGGVVTIVPTVAGTYTYALTCGGRRSGFASLQVR